MAWTEEMVEGLRQMWLEGLTANEIAKKLGVSKNSIVGKVHRLCLKARPSPIKKKDDETAPAEEIAAEAPAIETPEEILPEEEEPVAEVKAPKKVHKGAHHVKLMELDSHTCRWPLGDPRDEDFCFCGKKVRMGQTYCEEHANMAYVKATKK
ncbi:MAG: GcrA family cell cycle regulator [Alphaproteobacteria bacterium]